MRSAVAVIFCVFVFFLLRGFAAEQPVQFVPANRWLDTSGNPIEAHSGGMLEVHGTYYWYGENHKLGGGNKTGISVYSSRDLMHWKNEGLALPKESVPPEFRDTGVCERPKVIYNRNTRKYVMWMHLDANDYTEASAGVAVSDSPVGPFTFLRYFRPLAFDFGYKNPDRTLQKERRNTYRDMNLFLDDDGSAYVFYASEDNATMYVSRLNPDFTDVGTPAVLGKTWARILVNRFREAPAPFKFGGKYYLFSSGTTGWAPNPADLAVADNIFGPWHSLGNPAVGAEASTTHRSQPTFVLPVKGHPGCFIYMGDRWDASNLQNSSYVWLPFTVSADAPIRLKMVERWDMSIFDKRRE